MPVLGFLDTIDGSKLIITKKTTSDDVLTWLAAIGFCYFELLIQHGSREFIQGEQLRLTQLNDYLATSGGYDPEMFMDFTSETFQLFTDITAALDPSTSDKALDVLTQRFNDDASMAILYHLRLLAGSWLKGNRDQYEAWCETGVDGYCSSMIEPPEREIEELGIVLLVEALLKPAGFILEIAYLDRSAGTEVNTHRFPESNNSLGPFMHLLYRPGHYDILYKPGPTEIQVNRMAYEPTAFSDLNTISGGMDFNPLAMIPGMGLLGGSMSSMGQLGGQLGGQSLDFSPSPQSPWYPSSHADSSPTPPTQQMAAPCNYVPQPQQAPIPTQPTPPSNSVSSNPTHEIRFSRYQYEGPLNTSPEPTFQTNMFKNSHYNKAHYNNPDFTPEEYKPDADDGFEVPPRLERPSRRSRHGKGAGHSSDDGSDIKRER